MTEPWGKKTGDQLQRLRAHARFIFEAGLEAVNPRTCVDRALQPTMAVGLQAAMAEAAARGRIFVVGGGKASALMAQAIEERFGNGIAGGAVVVKYGHGVPLKHIQVIEAAHPVPDRAGLGGAEAVLDMACRAAAGDLLLCLISGGASALLPLPASGITLADKQKTTSLLLAAGSTIHEINAIRKHLSRIKGGGLALAAAPARVLSLILSDVVGDDLDVIGSGLTVPDRTTFADGLRILDKYALRDAVPPPVRERFVQGAAGRIPDTPKPGAPDFANVVNQIIGSNFLALEAAAAKAEELGYRPLILSSMLEGDARQAALFLSRIAREVRRSGNPVAPPACILCGGETTVNVQGGGLGGRCTEMALAAALDLNGLEGTLMLCAGTDGTDGPTDAAGAFVDGATVERAAGLEMRPAPYLADNDAYRFFHRLEDLLVTGPTRTNVMDLQIVLVDA